MSRAELAGAVRALYRFLRSVLLDKRFDRFLPRATRGTPRCLNSGTGRLVLLSLGLRLIKQLWGGQLGRATRGALSRKNSSAGGLHLSK